MREKLERMQLHGSGSVCLEPNMDSGVFGVGESESAVKIEISLRLNSSLGRGGNLAWRGAEKFGFDEDRRKWSRRGRR